MSVRPPTQEPPTRPLVVRELPDAPGVVEAFASLVTLPYPLLLDSATAVTPVARYSFAMADPRMVVRGKGRQVTVEDRRAETVVVRDGRALDVVAELLYEHADGPNAFRGIERETPESHWITPATSPSRSADQRRKNWDELPPFRGGAAGYIGYEYGGMLETLPRPTTDDPSIPDVVMGIYDWVIAWDHATQQTWILGDDAVAIDAITAQLCGADASQHTSLDSERDAAATLPLASGPWTSTFDAASYEDAVEQVQAYIQSGEIFQANLSQRFCVPLRDDVQQGAWLLYQRLRTINPAPFASYFDFGDGVIVSISPERFLRAEPDGTVETRPIKGTRPRGASAAEDSAYQVELLRSEKDAAEHVMIVDVLRNDLSRVCTYGSVTVPALMTHERHPTVHHLVSTITGQLRPEATAIDLMHACFPGGSITGAPKIRAMEIIAELEPVTRGAYCGAIGYFSTTGAMDSSIAIRTCVVTKGHAYFSAGGGIVADSSPRAEYDETLTKARALLHALKDR